MLVAAKRALCDPGNVVSFQQGDAQDLSWFGSCAFDGVLCSSVVEYVEDPDELIREVGRVLKDDGLLIISIPPKKSLIRSVQKLLRPVIRIFGTDKYSYFDFSRFEIDSSAVADWLKRGNLQLEHISGFDPLIPKKFHPILPPALLICIGRKI
jgi:ubiquinone/menaquinone biosynthesis C-methylase UbiE